MNSKIFIFAWVALMTCSLAIGMGQSTASELELDGNIVTNGSTDWEDLFTDGTVASPPVPESPLPPGYGEPSFFRDFVPGAAGPDTSTFATGSKDTLNITPGWECTKSNNVNDKIDIVNAYAVPYVNPSNGHVILYFALERYSNEGDANVGFWFLQDDSVGCAPNGKTESFTGDHTDGDLLIVSEFSNGGVISTINAYRWAGGAGGYLDPNPVAAGGQCSPPGFGDPLCAIVNTSALLDGSGVPWHTETKKSGQGYSNDLDTTEFFEGTIDLTANNLLACFTRFIAVTRSSTSLTATLFDYAGGKFNLCGITITKACTTGVTNPTVGPEGDTILTLFDATITNTGIATVYDVSIQEDLTLGTGETCQIIEIDGTPITPVDISSGGPYEVAGSLSKDQSVIARIECETTATGAGGHGSGYANKVIAKASSMDGGLPAYTDDYQMPENETCPLSLAPTLSVAKDCVETGVFLIDQSGVLTVEVPIKVTVTNTGEELLEQVYLLDTHVSSFTYVDSNGDPIPGGFDNTLAPSEIAYFKGSYVPTAADDGETDPCKAQFTDEVTVSGIGALSGSPVEEKDKAICPLCACD